MEDRHSSSNIVEKLLVNLRVISQLQEGDKLEYNAQGSFVPQKPEMWTWAWRFFRRTDRWYILQKVQECVYNAEEMMNNYNGKAEKTRIHKALGLSVQGLRNLQLTYAEDVLFYQNIEVLLERISSNLAPSPS